MKPLSVDVSELSTACTMLLAAEQILQRIAERQPDTSSGDRPLAVWELRALVRLAKREAECLEGLARARGYL